MVLHEREETWMAEPSLPLKEGGTWPGSLVQASISRFSQLSCETEQGSQCGAKSHFLVIVILVPYWGVLSIFWQFVEFSLLWCFLAVCGFVQVACQGFLVREACVGVLVAVTRAPPPAFPRNPRGRLGFPGPTQGEG